MSGHGPVDPRDHLLHEIEETATPAHHAWEDVEHAMHESHEQKEAGITTADHAPHVSFMPMEVSRKLPPNLRQFTRWEYASEYVEWWKQGVTSKAQSVLFFGLGLLTLETFAPGALLMFALAARHQDLAWMYDFIAKKFGHSRTITLVD